eukprot:768755-Hanusia_phi.AAC.4
MTDRSSPPEGAANPLLVVPGLGPGLVKRLDSGDRVAPSCTVLSNFDMFALPRRRADGNAATERRPRDEEGLGWSRKHGKNKQRDHEQLMIG